MQSYISFMDRFNKFLLIFVGVLLGIMTFFICTQVFYRYALNESLSWTEELARYLGIWIVFLGTSIATGRREMIAVEAIVQFIPRKIETIFRTTVLFLSVILCFYLIVYGVSMVQEVATQKSTALRIPMWIPYSSIPVGATLILLNLTSLLIRVFQVKGERED
ncbi:TRAP transporter small permease [bacterium LRH843]|nr:TRAP transporter small permease [bacterium LRH843]